MRELSIYAKRDMAQNKAENEAHAEKLKAAQCEAEKIQRSLLQFMDPKAVSLVARLIDAKVELALLERRS